ncbi:hypothetical protein K2Z84_32050 [Candidatus Binatia bacterium]|nr:hypothetical protein [Candidatus Binatia bacterium]
MIAERLALPFVLLLPACAHADPTLEYTETLKEPEVLHRLHHQGAGTIADCSAPSLIGHQREPDPLLGGAGFCPHPQPQPWSTVSSRSSPRNSSSRRRSTPRRTARSEEGPEGEQEAARGTEAVTLGTAGAVPPDHAQPLATVVAAYRVRDDVPELLIG